ncbi:MAG: nitroreductase family protein [Thermoleophilia bacterium]
MTTPGGRLTLRLPDYVLQAWKELVPFRRSRRTFLPERPEEAVLTQLSEFVARLPAGGRARAVVLPTVDQDLFRGIIGSYGRVAGAPSALAMIGLHHPGMSEATGYIGEAAVLEATRLGLDTCWVGGYFRPEKAAGYLSLRPGERVWAVSPLGYAATSPTISERVMKRAARSNQRVPARKLTPGDDPESWPGWAQAGLMLARLAPSAVNRQPWRFHFENGDVVVEEEASCRDYGIPKRLDCGIAMLHFEVGARCVGVQGEWEHLSGSRVARFAVSS